MTRVLVLGWDALDIQHITSHTSPDAFGEYTATIDTHVNPVIDAPHTKELWPSMITGQHPDEHGVYAAREDGVAWDNPLFLYASKATEGILPDDVKSWLGRRLRERGAGIQSNTPAYYSDRDIPTVFDHSEGAVSISVPNHQTQADRDYGTIGDRGALWNVLDVWKNEDHTVDPGVSLDRVYAELGERVGTRVGRTTAALQTGSPLVWTWFGVLDSIGHMAPCLDHNATRDWYQTAATITQHYRTVTPDDTVVIAVSDHGIDQDGVHTEYATIASDTPGVVEDVDHVFDLADWIRRQDIGGTRVEVGMDEDAAAETKRDLEALGYRV